MPPPSLWLAVGLYAAAAAADIGTSAVAMKRGLREGNPILGKKNPLLVSALITLATLAVPVVAVMVAPASLNAALWFCGVFAAYRGVLAARNGWLLWKKEKV